MADAVDPVDAEALTEEQWADRKATLLAVIQECVTVTICIEDCVIDNVWWKGGVEIDRMCRNGAVTIGQSLCFLAHAPEPMDSE